jgi:hypothetical protein
MPVVSDKYRGTLEYFNVHSELVTAAQYQGVVTYVEVARILGIRQLGHHMAREVGQILGEISEDEVLRGRPMLSALAVGGAGMPSKPFFDLASQLGLLQDDSLTGQKRFWNRVRTAVYQTWQRRRD